MYQQIMLVGNLGRDPEMRYTPSGVPVSNFSLAVNKRYQTQDGQWQDKTLWFRVTAWRRTAETVSQYLTKGAKVLVVGELEEPSTYVDREGNNRVSLEVTAQTVRFLDSRGDNANAGGYQSAGAGAGAGQRSGNNNYGGDMELTDEDIPF